jgi:argininosuccinate synthase
LREHYDADVIAYVGDVGQVTPRCRRRQGLHDRASHVIVEDLRDEFVTEFVFPDRAGAVYEHKYLLGTSLARPVIAKHQVHAALRRAPPRWRTAARRRATTRCDSKWRTRPSHPSCV